MNHQFTEEEEKEFVQLLAKVMTEGSAREGDLRWIRAHDQRLLSHIRVEVEKMRCKSCFEGLLNSPCKENTVLDEVLALLT